MFLLEDLLQMKVLHVIVIQKDLRVNGHLRVTNLD
jgi:hypothetical protein